MSSREPAVHDWPAYRKIPTATGVHRLLEVRIGEDDDRRLAAGLERDALERPCPELHQPAAGLAAAGEADLVDPRVGGQRLADDLARADDAVGHAVRQAPRSGRAARRSPSTTPGASLAGLSTNVQPAAIAAPILRSGRSTGSFHGVIRRAHPDRLLEDEVEQVARRRGRDLAADHPGGTRVEQDAVDRRRDLALADVADRLAHLGRDEAGERLGLLAQQVGELEQDRRPLASRGGRPGAVVEGRRAPPRSPARRPPRRTAARPRRGRPWPGRGSPASRRTRPATTRRRCSWRPG